MIVIFTNCRCTHLFSCQFIWGEHSSSKAKFYSANNFRFESCYWL